MEITYYEQLLRVELWYDGTPDCPLKAITHETDGQRKRHWEEFMRHQETPFQERSFPSRLPPLLEHIRLESSVIAISAARLSAWTLLDRRVLEACAGNLPQFYRFLSHFMDFETTRIPENHPEGEVPTGDETYRYVYYVHSQYRPFRNWESLHVPPTGEYNVVIPPLKRLRD